VYFDDVLLSEFCIFVGTAFVLTAKGEDAKDDAVMNMTMNPLRR